MLPSDTSCRAPVAVRLNEPQCITSFSGCLWVQFRMSTAPVHGCHISILLCIYLCKIIAFVNFQEIKEIFIHYYYHGEGETTVILRNNNNASLSTRISDTHGMTVRHMCKNLEIYVVLDKMTLNNLCQVDDVKSTSKVTKYLRRLLTWANTQKAQNTVGLLPLVTISGF